MSSVILDVNTRHSIDTGDMGRPYSTPILVSTRDLHAIEPTPTHISSIQRTGLLRRVLIWSISEPHLFSR